MKNHAILKAIAERPWMEFTLQDIKKLTKSKSVSYVYKYLDFFYREGIIRKRIAGNVAFYSLSLSNRAFFYAGSALEYSAWSRKDIPVSLVDDLAGKVPLMFFSLLVTGSYSSGKATKSSDMDTVIICPDGTNTKKVYSELSHFSDMAVPLIHLHVFTVAEFRAMLISKGENFGKEVVRNFSLFRGGDGYMSVVMEAVNSGFNG